MKRKSTLILIAVFIVAISIPLFALAESTLGAQPADGTGFMNGRPFADEDVVDARGNQYALSNGYSVDADGYCYYLDENGEAQRLYTRAAVGENLALRVNNGVFCWAADDDDTDATLTRNSYSTRGFGCRRWN